MNESSAKTIDRRPVATRNRKWAQSATTWLASRNVSSNAISIAGMCACIVSSLAQALSSVIAAFRVQLRLTANMLDEMVALASARDSKIGELYNEVPDRVSDARCSSAQGTHGVETSRLVRSQRSREFSVPTFEPGEESLARLTSLQAQ